MTAENARKNVQATRPVDGAATAVTDASPSKVVVYRSEGQRLFAEVPGSLSSLARSVGASKQSILWWKSGDKTPGDAFRATIEKIHGIRSSAWAEAPTTASVSIPSREKSVPSNDTATDYDYLIRITREVLEEGNLKAVDKLKAVAELGKLRKQKDHHDRMIKKPVSDRDIVRSAAWVRLREALGAALKPYPEALAAVAEALKKLEV